MAQAFVRAHAATELTYQEIADACERKMRHVGYWGDADSKYRPKDEDLCVCPRELLLAVVRAVFAFREQNGEPPLRLVEVVHGEERAPERAQRVKQLEGTVRDVMTSVESLFELVEKMGGAP